MWKHWVIHILLVETKKIIQLLCKNNLAVSYKTEHRITIHTTVVLSRAVPEKWKLCSYKNSTWLFIAALSIISQNHKQPKCLLMGEWFNKLVHSYHKILLSKKERGKKEKTISTCNILDESPKNYSAWKKASPQRLCTVWFCLFNMYILNDNIWTWRIS